MTVPVEWDNPPPPQWRDPRIARRGRESSGSPPLPVLATALLSSSAQFGDRAEREVLDNWEQALSVPLGLCQFR